MQYDDVITNPRWRTDAILKIVFFAISRRHIGRSTQTLEQRWRITCRYRSCDQNCNFRKSKMADGRHFENSFISLFQLWIIRFRSNFVHKYKFPFRACKSDKKIEIFQIQDGGRTPYWKSFLGYISAPYWPIYGNFGMEMKNHMQTSVTYAFVLSYSIN